MASRKWILTAPHSVCPVEKTEGHPCDTLAWQAATVLNGKIRNALLFNKPTRPRSEGDLNRFETKDDVWTKQLQEFQKGPMKMGLIDVHSFPDDQKLDCYFISNKPYSTLVSGLYEETSKRFKTDLFEGGENAIILTSKVPSVLIEFNEGISSSRLSDLCDTITGVLQRFD